MTAHSRVLSLALVALLCAAAGALGQDDDATRIVGSWLFRSPELELRFEAKPDGSFTRHMRTQQGAQNSVGTYRAKGGVLEVTADGETTSFRMRFTDQGELEIVAEDGTGIRLARQDAPPTGAPLGGGGPGALVPAFPLAPAPGGHIVFTRGVMTRLVAGGLDESIPIQKLFVMDAAGGNARPLIFGEATTVVKEARWTWDYTHLAFSSDFHSERSALVHDAFVCAADGSPAIRITGNELKGPAPKGYGAITGLIQDNTKSREWAIDKPSSVINITAQGSGVIVHPGELTDIDIVNPDTQEKLRQETMRRFYIPHVAAGDQVWVKVWVSQNMGHLTFCQVRPGEVTDIGNLQVNECNYAASKPSLTPDGRYCVGMGSILSVDPNAKTNVAGVETTLGQAGGAEGITVCDVATGALVASVDALKMGLLSAKDPALGPDGQSIACSAGEPSLGNLTILNLADILAGKPQPRMLVKGERIWPSEQTLFKTWNIGCTAPAWSPDGRQIAFCRFVMSEDVMGDLWVVNADGSGLRQLTKVAPNQIATQPCFSPDGKRIAFTLVTGRSNPMKIEQLLTLQFTADIWTMGADGSNPTRLTTDGMSAEPAWGG